jgi:hypothetical protein
MQSGFHREAIKSKQLRYGTRGGARICTIVEEIVFAPNRAFDETYFSFNANGNSSSGLLPTDRPNTFRGYIYYELGWKKRFATDFGLFQYLFLSGFKLVRARRFE